MISASIGADAFYRLPKLSGMAPGCLTVSQTWVFKTLFFFIILRLSPKLSASTSLHLNLFLQL